MATNHQPIGGAGLRRMLAVAGCMAALGGAIVMSTPAAVGVGPRQPALETNEAFIDESRRQDQALDLADPKSVLAFVLRSLPDRVKVYPTENYYYFKFYAGQQRYAGNLRLDVNDRDQGRVNFAYFKDLTEWSEQAPVRHVLFGPEDGVKVERQADLVYRVSHAGLAVVFELNDLRHVKPASGTLAAGERYIGPVFDESGIQFLLVYNSEHRIFHYLLDERVPHEPLKKSRVSDRILIGQRTGFAYFADHKLPRKILIGVHESNARVNNYFDGPFDQLPDNFIEGEALRSAILEVEPQLKGRIDRLGISPGGADRYMIAPYAHYREEEELRTFHDCATSKDVPASHYHACFVIDPDAPSEEDGQPPPSAQTAPAAPPATAPPNTSRK